MTILDNNMQSYSVLLFTSSMSRKQNGSYFHHYIPSNSICPKFCCNVVHSVTFEGCKKIIYNLPLPVASLKIKYFQLDVLRPEFGSMSRSFLNGIVVHRWNYIRITCTVSRCRN